MSKLMKDVQVEVPYIVSRFILGEPAGSVVVYDDVGGITMPVIGTPTLGVAGTCRNDAGTSATGLGSASYFGTTATFALTSGLTIEGITAAQPSAPGNFTVMSIGSCSLALSTTNLIGSVTTTAGSFSCSNAAAYTFDPQHVVYTYDPIAQLQTLYLDGVSLGTTVANGTVNGTNSVAFNLLRGATASQNCRGQYLALYNGALSAARVAEHYAAFQQVLPDFGHSLIYDQPVCTT